MGTYYLNNYNLSARESFYSLFVSEIGLRHLYKAYGEASLGHAILAALELIPLLGALFAQIESRCASMPANVETGYKHKIIKSGSQMNCTGLADQEVAKLYSRRLDENALGVRFKTSEVLPFVMGGTCSAMSFSFADSYLAKRKELKPDEAIDAISPGYETSSETFRTTQAAFNTICKDPAQPVPDFKRAKVDAMLRLHERRVIDASEEIDLNATDSLQKIEAVMKKFPEGVFIVRCLQLQDNEKEEAYGHSMVLIRDGGRHYFYNPADGVHEIEKGSETEALHKLLSDVNNLWSIPNARIYKIA